jgi:hypothetical protein
VAASLAAQVTLPASDTVWGSQQTCTTDEGKCCPAPQVNCFVFSFLFLNWGLGPYLPIPFKDQKQTQIAGKAVFLQKTQISQGQGAVKGIVNTPNLSEILFVL